ncbi:MAG: phosphonate C-P lyase system protein PhnH [Oscillochloridaceae bacterium umkhey_bin13]
MVTPVMRPDEAQQRNAFMAMLWALSYPGRPQRLAVSGLAAFSLIGATLVDLETGFFTPDPTLAAELALTGGRSLPPDQAPYQFYPRVTTDDLPRLAQAPVGTYRDPDLGATLVLGCQFTMGTTLLLSGPGLAQPRTLAVAGLPEQLWALRQATSYPRGWDLVLLDGSQMVGLPRTTRLEVR